MVSVLMLQEPRKRLIDMDEEDLKTLGVEEWRKTVQNISKWRNLVMAAKTLRKWTYQKKKKMNTSLIIK